MRIICPHFHPLPTMKHTHHIIWLVIAMIVSGCANRREAQREIDLTHDKIIPKGTWAAGQIYALAKRGYVVNELNSWDLLDPRRYDGFAEYESNPAASNGRFVGVAKVGERIRIESLMSDGSGHISVVAVFLTGPLAGKKLCVEHFGTTNPMFGDYGRIYPPDPKYLRQIHK